MKPTTRGMKILTMRTKDRQRREGEATSSRERSRDGSWGGATTEKSPPKSERGMRTLKERREKWWSTSGEGDVDGRRRPLEMREELGVRIAKMKDRRG
ncbi:hypothetical protein U1Q18_045126 [Sarracenia purpurea var. burkii]